MTDLSAPPAIPTARYPFVAFGTPTYRRDVSTVAGQELERGKTITDELPQPGAEFETVVLSPPFEGHLATWDSVGRRTVWSVDRPQDYAELIGQGRTARTEVGERRYRECGMLDVSTGMLLVPSRYARSSQEAEAATFHLSSNSAARSGPTASFTDWLDTVITSAARRGDFVVIEGGGWDFAFEPYAFFMCARDEEGRWQSHVEANPYPAGSEIWPPQPPGAVGSTLTAPIEPGAFSAAAILLGEAVGQWAESPLALGLTFGSAPDGGFDAGGR